MLDSISTETKEKNVQEMKEHVKYEPIFWLTYGLAAFIAIFHVDFGNPNKIQHQNVSYNTFLCVSNKMVTFTFLFYEIIQSHFTSAQISNGNALCFFFTKRTVEFIGG